MACKTVKEWFRSMEQFLPALFLRKGDNVNTHPLEGKRTLGVTLPAINHTGSPIKIQV